MKAFTLIETLVAITVVLVAVLGPFQLVQQSLSNSYTARDQLIATALAEEGIEYVRSIRDSNYLYEIETGTDRYWLHLLNSTADGGGDCFRTDGCTVDPTRSANAEAVAECGTTCPPLRFNPTTKQYTQRTLATNIVTRFTRKVFLERINGSSDKQVKVTVTVTYTTSHRTHTVTVNEYLYNWL